MMISTCCATARVACVIAQSLMTYVQSRKSQITSMRATPIYLFNDEQRSWPMIEWREKDNMWTLAIFHFENVNQPEDGSWLMHSGIPYVTKQCWRRSRIDWNVANVNHLKILFGLAQHALGLMEWPVEDAISLCNHISSQNCSINEYGLINGLLIWKYDKICQPLVSPRFTNEANGFSIWQNKSIPAEFGIRRLTLCYRSYN